MRAFILSLAAGLLFVLACAESTESPNIKQYPTSTPYPTHTPKIISTNLEVQVDTVPKSCNSNEISISKEWKDILTSASFTKCVMPFGVLIGADYRMPDSYITQAAMILAEILDPDMDGSPNDPKVLSLVQEYHNAWLPMPFDPEPWHSHLEEQLGNKLNSYGLMIPKWWMDGEGESIRSVPDEHAKNVMVEEIMHFMTQFGYSRAYPEIFGVENWHSLIAKETKHAACEWWQHPENDCPDNPGYYDGDCSDPSCDVTEFYHQVVTTRAGMELGWRGIGFPKTKEELESKLSGEIKAVLDNPNYNQISNPLTFSYSYAKPMPTTPTINPL
tara:strand:+ start:314 stop:1303 length:990 start_codon:yes stop_codon:yes gene_type:complete